MFREAVEASILGFQFQGNRLQLSHSVPVLLLPALEMCDHDTRFSVEGCVLVALSGELTCESFLAGAGVLQLLDELEYACLVLMHLGAQKVAVLLFGVLERGDGVCCFLLMHVMVVSEFTYACVECEFLCPESSDLLPESLPLLLALLFPLE